MACLLALIAIPCRGQIAPTGPADTKGPCSPAVTGNNNKFNITCTGVSKDRGDQLVALLNRIAKNQGDANEMMKKLDACVQSTTPWRLTNDQKQQLQQSLKGMRAEITVSSLAFDENARLVATDLRDALGINAPMSIVTRGPNFDGVLLIISHTDFPDAALLQQSLIAVLGMRVPVQINPSMNPNEIDIIVGAKPRSPPRDQGWQRSRKRLILCSSEGRHS
jgi:hypothetical protein